MCCFLKWKEQDERGKRELMLLVVQYKLNLLPDKFLPDVCIIINPILFYSSYPVNEYISRVCLEHCILFCLVKPPKNVPQCYFSSRFQCKCLPICSRYMQGHILS